MGRSTFTSLPLITDAAYAYPDKRLNGSEKRQLKKQFEDFKGVAGIFLATNIKDFKQFVGNSNDLYKAITIETLNNPFSKYAYLDFPAFYRAIRSDGLRAFEFDIIYVAKEETQEELDALKAYYIDSYGTAKYGYN